MEYYHCDPECRDKDGDTPLHEACCKGHVDIVRYLVSELGCSTVRQNENGDIPLLEACVIQRVGTHMVIHYCMRLVMRVMWTLYGSILVNGDAV